MTTMRVPERGQIDIDEAAWGRLASHPDFWRLVDQKIVRVSQVGRHSMRLEAGAFVGRASIGSDTLELGEKVPGALESLLGFATGRVFRVERLEAPASDLGSLAHLLVRQFVTAVRSYVSRGREFRYSSRPKVGSLVGGRLDVTGTLALRARGLPHLAAFHQTILSRNVPKNRVVFRALHEIERIARFVEVDNATLAQARTLSMLFSDCRDAESLFSSKDRFVREAESILDESGDRRDEDMLRLAQVILSHQSFERTAHDSMSVPRAWFLNLESLFEAAVRKVLSSLCRDGWVVTRGRKPPVFPQTTMEFKGADLLIARDGVVRAVGDVKYKKWSGSADAADLYQLLVHAAAFSSPLAFLVFAGEEFVAQSLGLAATGCATWVFSVDIRRLRDDLAAMLEAIDLGAMGRTLPGRSRPIQEAGVR